MSMPQTLQQKIEELLSEVPHKDLKDAAEALSDTYRNSLRLGQELINGKIGVLAYIASRMPATYQAVSFVINSVKSKLETLGISTLLDVGAGPATATIAAKNILGTVNATLIERNGDMVWAGKTLLNDDSVWLNTSAHEKLQNADLVISAYMLNEMTEQEVVKTIKNLYNSANKALVIIDNGTKETFLLMKTVRKTLLELGANIIAPCANSNNCQNEWCHFSTRVTRTKLHKLLKGGDAPYEDEKFTYLVATKTPISNNVSRILRHPKILKGRVELEVCSENGIEKRTITKAQKELFKVARKSSWGDTI